MIKNKIMTSSMRALLLALCLACGGATVAEAATYRVGDVVTNFTFIARHEFTRPDGAIAPAGSTVHISEFSGAIIFLEWFAVWCPFCVAAAPQVETGIVDWYQARGGNSSGVPVVHVAVNQESASFYQAQTDNFIKQQGFAITLNDYTETRRNIVRSLFQASGQPIFAVINGVTNSPSHKPWQLLVNHLGYGDTDFNEELANFRALIDSVEAPMPAPQLGGARRVGADFEFTIQTVIGRSYRVQGTSNLLDWITLRTIAGSNAPVIFRDTNTHPAARYYRAVTP